MPVALTDVEILWYALVDHAEDVAVEPDGTVWCGGEEGQVYRGRLDREPVQVAALPGRVYGLVLDDEGEAYCCVVGEPTGLFHVTARGGTELVSGGAADRACVFPNQPALLDDGTILFTDSGEWGADDGCIFRVADSETTMATTRASRYPNGLAVSPEGARLAVVESTRPGDACSWAAGLPTRSTSWTGSVSTSSSRTHSGFRSTHRQTLLSFPGALVSSSPTSASGSCLLSSTTPPAHGRSAPSS